MPRASKLTHRSVRPSVRAADATGSMRALYIAVCLYFVVTLIRPQDLVPPLAVIRPGLLCIVGVIVAWAVHGPKRLLLHDAVFRWQLVLLLVVLVGVVVVANHRAWMNALWSYTEYMLVYSIALPTVMQRADYSRNLLRLLLLSFLFVAIWVVIHGGVGTASWMSDENDAAAALIVGACLGYATWTGVDARLLEDLRATCGWRMFCRDRSDSLARRLPWARGSRDCHDSILWDFRASGGYCRPYARAGVATGPQQLHERNGHHGKPGRFDSCRATLFVGSGLGHVRSASDYWGWSGELRLAGEQVRADRKGKQGETRKASAWWTRGAFATLHLDI